jgi:hypothetical protein
MRLRKLNQEKGIPNLMITFVEAKSLFSGCGIQPSSLCCSQRRGLGDPIQLQAKGALSTSATLPFVYSVDLICLDAR